jgi:hypothetical protein
MSGRRKWENVQSFGAAKHEILRVIKIVVDKQKLRK